MGENSSAEGFIDCQKKGVKYKNRVFNNLIGMLYGPTNLPTFNEFIKISVAEEGEIKRFLIIMSQIV